MYIAGDFGCGQENKWSPVGKQLRPPIREGAKGCFIAICKPPGQLRCCYSCKCRTLSKWGGDTVPNFDAEPGRPPTPQARTHQPQPLLLYRCRNVPSYSRALSWSPSVEICTRARKITAELFPVCCCCRIRIAGVNYIAEVYPVLHCGRRRGTGTPTIIKISASSRCESCVERCDQGDSRGDSQYCYLLAHTVDPIVNMSYGPCQ